jgi:hypothetical protein
MRKRYRVLLLAAIVAALVVPVGFALSPGDSIARGAGAPPAAAATVATSTLATSTVIARREPAGAVVAVPLPDGAKLFLVGSVLFGLAALVRKTV